MVSSREALLHAVDGGCVVGRGHRVVSALASCEHVRLLTLFARSVEQQGTGRIVLIANVFLTSVNVVSEASEDP